VAEGTDGALTSVCHELGVAPSWGPVLERLLPGPDAGRGWSAGALQQWRRRLLSAFDNLTAADLRAVADAARPGRSAPVSSRLRPRVETLALTVAVAIAGDEAGWRGRRGRTGQALLERGLRTPAEARAAAEGGFQGLWATGAARDDIAAALGLTNAATARQAHDAPARLGSSGVTDCWAGPGTTCGYVGTRAHSLTPMESTAVESGGGQGPSRRGRRHRDYDVVRTAPRASSG
jgi:hypothetical protein